MNFLKVAALAAAMLSVSACVTAPTPSFKLTRELDPDIVPTFTSPEEVDAYAAQQQRERVYANERRRAHYAEQRRIREEARKAQAAERAALYVSEAEELEARAAERLERAAKLDGEAELTERAAAREELVHARRLRRRAQLELEREDRADVERVYALSSAVTVTASKAVSDVAITNTQVDGVDEGGIVKATTDFLVILRRGRVHVVRHGDDSLEPVSSIDAFPPGDENPGDTWYDEMLLHQGMIVVIGYSYGEDGTEISRFNLSDDGMLTYRDTHYLSSSDYYSSSNYASRMIGGRFFTYTPTRFSRDWREDLPFLERRNADGSRTKVGETLVPSAMGVTASLMIDPSPSANLMHGITACDVLSQDLTCSTRTVLGTWSSEYYFSADAAYLWTGTGHDTDWGRASRNWGSTLYRIPFDRSDDITAISVQGAPVDQFSFHEDAETNSLFVMTVGDFVFENSGNFGLMMWESELAFGDASLLQIPLDAMGNGAVQLPQQQYRPLPEMNGRVQNRFVGRHLMLGTGYWGYEDEPPEFYITPLDAPWVQRLEIPHSVSRLDRLGNDGVAIGSDDQDALGFTTIEFAEERQGGRVGSTYMLPAAYEGENRSQAFYWQGDADDPEGNDGVMALPVTKQIDGYDLSYLGSSTAMFYMERKDGELSPIGELGAQPGPDVIAAAQEMEKLEEEGDCLASCVDWYGNARPIFIGDRIFALLGDEIVEGTVSGGRITEERRVNFAR